MIEAFKMHSDSGIIISEVSSDRKVIRNNGGGRYERRDRFDRGSDRNGGDRDRRNGSGGFRGRNSESGKEWRTRKEGDNNKFSSRGDSGFNRKKKDGFKKNR